MREITYSQGVIIAAPALLPTLGTFCERIWLPDTIAADHVQAALADAQHPGGDPSVWEPRRAAAEEWENAHRDLFKENVISRLPPNSQVLGDHPSNGSSPCLRAKPSDHDDHTVW